MATPTQRRTSSAGKRRRSHRALKNKSIVKDTGGTLHIPHCATPGATEYNGHPIHVKGRKKAMDKLAGKTNAPVEKTKEKTEVKPKAKKTTEK